MKFDQHVKENFNENVWNGSETFIYLRESLALSISVQAAMSLLTVLSIAGAIVKVAQAYSAEEVQYAYDVLNDLPQTLASPYCSRYAAAGLTVTATSTAAQYTTTTTLGCNEVPSGYPGYGKPPKTNDAPYPGITKAPYDPNDPIDWFVTSTTTTTITVTTYSTTTIYPNGVIATADNTPFMPTSSVIASPTDSSLALPTGALEPYLDDYTGPLDVPKGGMGDFQWAQARDAAPFKALKRSAKFIFKRQSWCDAINKPCRLALYDEWTISDACVRYLGISSGYVTVTTTVYAAVATETSKFCTPGSGSAPIETGSPYPGYDDESAGEDYGEEGKGDEGYGEEEGGYEGGDESYGGDTESYGEEGEGEESYGEEGEDYGSAESEYGSEEGDESYGGDSGKPSHSGKPSYGKPSHSKPSYGGHGGKPSAAYDSEYPKPSGYDHEEGSYGTYAGASSTPSWGEGYPVATDIAYEASTPSWGAGYPVATDSAYEASTPSFGEGYPIATDLPYGAEPSGIPEGGYGGEEESEHGQPGGQHGPPGGQHGPPGQEGEGQPWGQHELPENGGEGEKKPPKGYCLVKKPKQKPF